ncbi:MAG: sulfurtransferase [Sulfobacillus thermosulfidooxidans]|uniref:Rhodanese domain-containing protein n=1 Tax=Sulfobacillus thermotolerans TaxID=338644 RepID=A0ABM6RQS3_9FIRM|nr:sulfurtransferase [Sulfobacillus sp. hq2]AUW93616.1 hypothetical protein BXT84_06385 [Sulfobacillus thermotolerans]POB10860.1 sulfurtransferase [Sulfobacillus sp. hq2]PSR36845.1 MAG: sulfurtransferase [Sulfobacillus thermosulfidooxidans]
MKHPLVDAQWLAAQDPENVVIADCRYNLLAPAQAYIDYQKGHIPGAFFLDLERDLCGPIGVHGGRHPLPDREQFAHVLSRIGMTEEKTLVAYDTDGSGAAHLWWLAGYYGLTNIRVLQGGYLAWITAKLPVSTKKPAISRTPTLILTPHTEWLATREEVITRHSDQTLIDSRSYERFIGEYEPIDPIPGRIPGAIHRDWAEVYDKPAHFRPLHDLRQHFANIDTKQPPLVYCGSGVSACSNVLALHLLDIPAVLYAGSYSDWISYETAPVARGRV